MRGDIFGLLAAHPLTPLVSLHHPDHTDPIFPNMTTTKSLQHLFEAVNVDSERILQQTVCYERRFSWTISVSWGYGVQVFQNNMLLPDVLRVEKTFKQWKEGNVLAGIYTFNTRELHPDQCKRPTIFYLDKVSSGKDGIISSYRKYSQNCSYKEPMKKLEVIKVFTNKLYLDNKQVTYIGQMYFFFFRYGLFYTSNYITYKLFFCIKLQIPRRHCCDVLPSNAGDSMEIAIRECKYEEMIYMH